MFTDHLPTVSHTHTHTRATDDSANSANTTNPANHSEEMCPSRTMKVDVKFYVVY